MSTWLFKSCAIVFSNDRKIFFLVFKSECFFSRPEKKPCNKCRIQTVNKSLNQAIQGPKNLFFQGLVPPWSWNLCGHFSAYSLHLGTFQESLKMTWSPSVRIFACGKQRECEIKWQRKTLKMLVLSVVHCASSFYDNLMKY